MKKLIAAAFLLSGMIVFAQNDKIVTTKVKKQTVVKNGEKVDKKVKVITTKTQEVKFDKDQKHQLNQDRVPAPIAVTKVYMIDNDKDPFYDKVTKVKYYNMDNKKYAFSAEGNALNISYFENDKEVNVGKAVRSKFNNYYVISSKKMNGVGYFTKDNDFVIEYYSPTENDTKIMMFEDLKF
ncbi:hypothetical protein U8527_04195 [Kordia algicida OT-1]|uniref:Doublecortin domain-containing protein n=1 Tax=Kordia algicida OT-1 TaxID=391587 RepID=A9DPU3_9FLAO|nr:hypothetical protein [Kordia algicida]EDP97522.1 hypothetical protein KAOT1_20207 [Kordia algicida OT-1]